MAQPAIPRMFLPATVSAGTALDFIVAGTTYTATLNAGTYRSPEDLIAEAQRALNAASSGAFTLSVGTGGHVNLGPTISGTVLAASGSHAGSGGWALLGFGGADVPFSAGPLLAPASLPGLWIGDDPALDDSGDVPTFQRAQQFALTGRMKGLSFPTRYTRTVKLGFLASHKVFRSCEGTTHQGEAIERIFDTWGRVRYWPDASKPLTWGDYTLDQDTAKAMPRNRAALALPRYAVDLSMLAVSRTVAHAPSIAGTWVDHFSTDTTSNYFDLYDQLAGRTDFTVSSGVLKSPMGYQRASTALWVRNGPPASFTDGVVTATLSGNGDCFTFFGRMNAAGSTFVQALVSLDGWRLVIQDRTSGTAHQLLSGSASFAPGLWAFSFIGPVLQVLRNGVVIGSATTACLTPGSAGVGVQSQNTIGGMVSFDDLTIQVIG